MSSTPDSPDSPDSPDAAESDGTASVEETTPPDGDAGRPEPTPPTPDPEALDPRPADPDAIGPEPADEPEPMLRPEPAAYAPPPGYAPPSEYRSPAYPPPAGTATADQRKRPAVWVGILSGLGMQVAALVLGLVLLAMAAQVASGGPVVLFLLLPFIVLLVGPALLMISWRWRRFAVGVLIVSAAVWITLIGPCLGLMAGI